MKNRTKRLLSLALVPAMIVSMCGTAVAAENAASGGNTEIVNLRVDEQTEPIMVDPGENAPLNFSWEMVSNILGQEQSAYQIVVKDESGTEVWNSGKVESGMSNDIAYEGAELTADSKYTWEVTVWDASGVSYTRASTFETGWLSHEQSAWQGADFIGIKKLILDADRTQSFGLETDVQITEGNTGSILFGANDFRLQDEFNNYWKLSDENGTYIRAELDISELVNGVENGHARINMYAPGYDKSYSADEVSCTFEIPEEAINVDNMREVHNLHFDIIDGNISGYVDGAAVIGSMVTGFFGEQFRGVPIGANWANNVNVYPRLNDIGFGAREGDQAVFTNFKITTKQVQGGGDQILMDAETGSGYGIFEDADGKFIDNGGTVTVADNAITVSGDVLTYSDPSFYGETMLRKEFTVDKPVADAKIYISAMGAFDMEINGETVAPENYFEPGDSMYRESLYYTAYDVTDHIKQGENAIGATLAAGWYTGYQTFTVDTNYSFWGDYEALLSTLVLTYEDGTKDYIVTDPSWEGYKESPVRYASMYHGERYDARKEAAVEGFSTADYDSSAWTENVEIIEPREWFAEDWGLYARQDAPVHVYEVLDADHVISTCDAEAGTFTYDMGVNMVGVPEVTFPTSQMKEGDVVTFITAEQIFPGLPDEMNANYTFEKTYTDENGEEYTKTVSWADIFGENAIEEEADRNGGLAGRIAIFSNRSALDTDTYTVSKEDIEAGSVTWSPEFTFRGYRYVQITVPGNQEALPVENVKGIVLTSSPELTATYKATAPAETTDAYGETTTIGDLINQLYANTTRSQLGNFVSLPTDCPQRNERMGWTGDAQVYSLMSTYASDTQNFWSTWMQALRDSQGVEGSIGSTCPDFITERPQGQSNATTWAGAVCMVPWVIYSQYGDTTIVTEYADIMWKWLDGVAGGRLSAAMESEDMKAYLTSNPDQYSFSEELLNLRSSEVTGGLCDHLAMDGVSNVAANGALYIYLTELTSIMFQAVDDPRADVLMAYYDLAKEEWNKTFIDPETGMTRGVRYDGDTETWYDDDTQSSYASPLNYNIISDTMTLTDGSGKTYKEAAAEHLARIIADPSLAGNYNTRTEVYGGFGGGGKSDYTRDQFSPYSITTGFNGTPNILDALSANGQNDTAYKMVESISWPSWLYPITQGATTVYERWDSYKMAFENGIDSDNGMNSFNHFALGASSSWFWEYSLGIRNSARTEEGEVGETAGFKHITLQPMAGPGYTAAEGSYISNYGKIESAWTTTNDTDGEMASLDVTIPANTTATLYLPASGKNVNIPEELSAYVTVIGETDHYGEKVTEMELASGSYSFVIGEEVDVAMGSDYVID